MDYHALELGGTPQGTIVPPPPKQAPPRAPPAHDGQSHNGHVISRGVVSNDIATAQTDSRTPQGSEGRWHLDSSHFAKSDQNFDWRNVSFLENIREHLQTARVAHAQESMDSLRFLDFVRLESSRIKKIDTRSAPNLSENHKNEVIDYLASSLGGLRDKHNCKLEEGNETIIFLEKLEQEILSDEDKLHNGQPVAQEECFRLLNHVVQEITRQERNQRSSVSESLACMTSLNNFCVHHPFEIPIDIQNSPFHRDGLFPVVNQGERFLLQIEAECNRQKQFRLAASEGNAAFLRCVDKELSRIQGGNRHAAPTSTHQAATRDDSRTQVLSNRVNQLKDHAVYEQDHQQYQLVQQQTYDAYGNAAYNSTPWQNEGNMNILRPDAKPFVPTKVDEH